MKAKAAPKKRAAGAAGQVSAEFLLVLVVVVILVLVLTGHVGRV